MSIRVLVVDDEPLVALDIAQQLSEAGYEIVGPATSVAGAFRLLKEKDCDAVVLDVRLGDETSEGIAQELRTIGKPFVVLSGYSGENLKAKFGDAPLLSKPPRLGLLVAALKDC